MEFGLAHFVHQPPVRPELGIFKRLKRLIGFFDNVIRHMSDEGNFSLENSSTLRVYVEFRIIYISSDWRIYSATQGRLQK